MPSRKHRARIAKSRASKMWMEFLEQRQLLAPIAGEVSPLMAGEGLVTLRPPEEANSAAAWVADTPREVGASRRDDDPGNADGVVVMVL